MSCASWNGADRVSVRWKSCTGTGGERGHLSQSAQYCGGGRQLWPCNNGGHGALSHYDLLLIEERQAGDRQSRIACRARRCSGVDSIKSSSCRSGMQPLLFFFRPHRLSWRGSHSTRPYAPPKRTKLADVSAGCRRAAVGTRQFETLIDRCRLFFSGPLASKFSRVPSAQFGIAMGLVSLSTAKPVSMRTTRSA